MNTQAQLIADLTATRTVLETRGRCRGDLWNDDGEVCLIGAVCAATGVKYTSASRRATACRAALMDQLDGQEPAQFNDEHADDRDVLDLIEKTLCSLGGMA